MGSDVPAWGRLVAPAVALCVAGASIAVGFLAADVSRQQERRLLTERAGELAAVLSVSISDSRSTLTVAGLAASLPGGAAAFDRATARTVQSGSVVAVAQQRGTGYAVLRSAGTTAPASGAVLAPAVGTVIARAQRSADLVSAVVEVQGRKHAVLALAVEDTPGTVAYLDSALQPASRAPSAADSPYRELDVALYASAEVDPDALVLVSGRVPGSDGPVVTRQLQVGADTWSVAVAAREPLIGTLASAFPWVIGAGGVLTAAVLGLLIHTLTRRRAYALQLVEERTHLLRDAQRAAEQANQTREEFLASVSHDIRAPLTAIMGFTEMMAHAEPRRQDEFVERVQRNVTTLRVMVDNMLDNVRLKAGALDVDLEPLCLKGLVERCLQDLEPVLSSHPVSVTGTPVTVVADRLAFSRVLANVLINAVRYSPEGTPIAVVLSADQSQGRVVVADRGRGIEEADLESVFDEFVRGSRARSDGGSGLGLFSVHQLVDAQHGSVRIASVPGEGTTVTIALPLAA